MSLISIIIVLALAGLALWAVNAFIPMQAGVRKVLNIAVVVILVLWLLKVTGILSGLPRISV
jgi:hypothetical protein